MVDKLCKVDVLILDDFGKQRETDFAQERIANIIDQRHSAKSITIVTTNLNLDELGAWDSSTVSRMFDRSMSVAVPMFGPGYLRKGVSCGCVLDRPPSPPRFTHEIQRQVQNAAIFVFCAIPPLLALELAGRTAVRPAARMEGE